MTSGQKAAVSLLCTVLIFSAFAVAAFAGLFSVIETRFYQPAVVHSVQEQLSSFSENLDEYVALHKQRFIAFGEAQSVKNCVLSVQSDDDIAARSTLSGVLLSETAGLQGIRIIDSGGKRIQFSTFDSDILKKQATSITYENYTKIDELPYEVVMAPENSEIRVLFDSARNRIIYSYPFTDAYDLYRGTVLFYVSADDYSRYLTGKKLTRLSDIAVLVGNELPSTGNSSDSHQTGFVFGMPLSGSELLIPEIIQKWQEGLYGTERLVKTENGAWVLFTDISSSQACVAWVYSEDIFLFSDTVKILLLVCTFVTLYLVIFLLFNLRQDDMVVIRDRIRRFQFALVNQYLETNEEVDWKKVSRDLALRKHDVSQEVKKSLGRRAKRHSETVDNLLENSWDEIFGAVNRKAGLSKQPYTENKDSSINAQEIKQLLEQVLSTTAVNVKTSSSENTAVVKKILPVEPLVSSRKEKVSDAEPVEEVEELEEVSDAEPVEEVEELEEVADAEPVEEVEELEEVSDTEPVEEVEELEEVSDAEPVEEVEELEEVSDAEPVEEVEELEEVSDAEPVEELLPDDFFNDDKSKKESEDAHTSLSFAEPLCFDTPNNNYKNEKEIESDFNIISPDFSDLDLPAPVAEAEAEQEAAPVAEAEAEQEAAPVAEAEAEQEAAPAAEAEVEQEAEPAVEAEAEHEAAPVVEAEVEQEAAPVAEAEAEQEAAPVAETEVEQEAEPAVEAEAEVEHEVAPVVETEVEQEAEPAAEAVAEQEAASVAEAVAEHEAAPAAEAEAEQEAAPVAETEVEQEAAPAVEAVAEHEAEPAAEAEAEHEIAPVVETEVEQEAEPAAEAVAEQEAAPAAEAEVEQEAEPAVEAEAEHEAAPVVEAEVEQEAAPVAEAEVEHEAAPAAEAEAEQEAEPVAEAEVEQEAEPVAEAEVEQEAAPVAEAEVEHEAAPAVEAEAEQEAAPVAEAEAEHEAAPAAEAEAEVEHEVAPVVETEVEQEAEPAAEAVAEQEAASVAEAVAEHEAAPAAEAEAEHEAAPVAESEAEQEAEPVAEAEAEQVEMLDEIQPFSFIMQYPSEPDESVPELEDAEQGEVIVERNGLFIIPNKLPESNIQVDKEFQKLVDSVLH